MIFSIANRSMVSILAFGVMTGLIGLLYVTRPAYAQDMPTTASEVVDRETLKTFVDGAKAHIEGIFAADEWLPPFLDSTRMEGDWKHENVFLMLLNLDGTVLFHADDDAAAGKNLFNLQDDRGEEVVRALLEAGLMDGGHVEYHWDDPGDDEDDPVKMAYATSFFGNAYNSRVVLVGGFYQDLSHVELPMVDTSLLAEPDITATDVMDRASLQAFVIGAAQGVADALSEHGTHRYSDILDLLRIEDGHWRHGSIYLFILTDDGYVLFHGADRTQEARNQSHLEDINGVKFVQEFIKVAKESGSGFVEYQYDDPSVPGDEETGTPKLSYIHSSFETIATGRRVIFGAGIYFDVSDVADSITLAAEPSSITEGGGSQTVTITATNTGDPLPVSVRLPLTLSGTASGDDYTVTGDMHILIPAESTVGTTELAFDVANDGVDEPEGETIVVTASHNRANVATAEITLNDLRPTLASEVVDRETLKTFVDGAKAHIEGIFAADEWLPPFLDSTRMEGDWKHENVFLMLLNLDGTVLFHADDDAAAGKNLFNLQDDRGEEVVRALLEAGLMDGGHVEYHWDDPGDDEDDPVKMAYATSFFGNAYNSRVVLVGGFYQDLSHVELPMVDTSLLAEPDITATDVMDRASLQAFVIGAAQGVADALSEHGTHRYSDILDLLRIEDGHWRHGSIYLFILTDDGYVLFHGADRTQEARNQSHLEDINGVKFVQEFIKVAKESGSGFVEYQYDDPSVPGDEETGTPKLSYIHSSFETIATGRRVIFGAGIYFDVSDVADSITLAAEPSSITEGGGSQTVTITATNTGDPLPVSVRLPLTLSGTASGDDYTVTGDMHILIPAESTVGTTELAFDVANDGVDEPEGETIVVTASHNRANVATAEITLNDLRPTLASEVVDRETLKTFVDGAKAHIEGIFAADEWLPPFLDSTRMEGDWKHENVFLMLLNLDGTVLFHADDDAAAGKNLFNLQDDRGEEVVRALLEAGLMDGGHVEYHWDDPGDDEDDPVKMAYATSFFGNAYNSRVVLVGGFYQDLSHVELPMVDTSLLAEPDITATDVMDRASLQAFVIGAAQGVADALSEHGTHRYSDILDLLRIEDGHWRHGSIYLFILTDDGYVLFHGADRTQEARNQSHLEDINGVKFVQEFIKVAKESGSGFVEYQYDDPSVPGDEETGTPKLSYIHSSFETIATGRRVIFGAGIYFDVSDVADSITLAAEPSSITEGGGSQTVTITATNTGDPLPVSVRLPLTLSGTASGDDYTVTGDMHILIPAESTVGTTELAFDVANDGVDEPEGETIVVTASHNRANVATAEITLNDLRPTLASEVVDRETLKTFVDGAKAHIEGIFAADEWLPPFLDSTRMEGDWKHENVFLMLLNLDGTVLFHADDDAAAGKNLFNLQDDRGEEVVRALLEAGLMDGGHVEYHWDDPGDDEDDPVKMAYATSFFGNAYNSRVVLVGGFYQDLSHVELPMVDTSLLAEPDITATDVMDRASLQAFVIGAAQGVADALSEHGTHRYSDILDLLRIEDGHWRHGSIYLFILTDDGYVLFHGADRTQEARNQSHLEDINGVKFVQEFIKVAKESGSGFVEYQYDDPSVPGDEETGTPKLSYIHSSFETIATGRRVIFGAGIYFDVSDVADSITLAAEPSSITEGGGSQTVTITATNTGDPLPVSVRLPLTLSGTASGDDYTVTGDMHILIPAESTVGTTELAFDVANDGVDEPEGETIVVTASHNRANVATAEITLNDLRPTFASEVVDRETLKGFVETVADSLERITDSNELPALGVAFRTEGDWKQGDLYLSVLTIAGEMFFHGDDPTRDGLDISDLEDDSGEKVVQKILAAANSGGGFVEFTWDDPNDPNDDPERVAYATRYTSGFGVGDFILVGGFSMDIPDPAETTLPDPPAVQAKDVVDRESLRAFVKGAIDWSFAAFEIHGVETSVLTAALRDKNGPFIDGSIYLFILTTEGYVFFHGADMTQEGAVRIDLEDLNGIRFIEKLIEVAVAGGGFVEYNYDDPAVEGDEELGSPKVSYAETIEFPEFFPDQTFVVGAGFYRRPVDDVPAITLEVDRETLVEGEDGQEVTVTATLTEDPVPVATIIDLTLEGTATSDDYTSGGTLEIIIPGDATSASTTLTFDVIDDAAGEDGETIVVKATYEGLEVGAATISVLDVLVPPLPVGDVTAADVKDRASLRSFVQAAKAAYIGAIDEVGLDHHGDVVEAFRVEDGNWRLGEIYIFFLQTDGLLDFHGANPSIENTNIFDVQDLNGVYYTRELIAAAQAGGGYVEYYFDNPTVDGDEETGSPKVGYTETVMVDGLELVIGSGFYFDLTGYVPEITLTVTPETVSEDGGTQTVRVTATQTSGAIPITTVIPIALSGTASSEDYSVRGNLGITIPGEAAEGSTELAITVINDDVYESGGETIIVTASYDGQDLDSATVTITDSYDAPAVVGSPPSVTLDSGESETINAGALFSGTDLSLSASTSDNNVATAVMSAATLTVTGVRKGSATVTVSARNAAGEASLTVGVTVTAIAAERMVYENILSAMGRNMLSSVSSTIGGRFSDRTGGQGFAVGGRRIDGFASSVAALARLTGHGRQVSAKHLALLNDGENRRYVNSGYLLSTSSFSYALEDGTANGGLRWSVWGAGDLQNFRGEPDVNTSYDGDMKTAYVGFDVATERNWMAGIALSHAAGQSDYDVTVASGSLESRLTSVLPYLRWQCITGLTEVWSIVGLGTGEVEADDATSDLSMRMAMVGARTRLAASGDIGLDLVGDAGLSRLSTSDSESASLSDLNADVQRIRVGLEGSRSAKLSGGTTITPYAQVAGRYDGGDGQTGQGLEVSGGIRLSGGRIGINAQGRFLAVHTADGYSENGVSVAAYLNPGSGGTGLSMSVAPRIGAGTGDSGMMWRDRPLAGTSVNGRNNARAFKAEVGYGLAYPTIGMLMTPFGEMYLLGDDRRQMRLGARLAQSGSRAGGASLELSGMRLDRHGSASDHRIGLLARMSF